MEILAGHELSNTRSDHRAAVREARIRGLSGAFELQLETLFGDGVCGLEEGDCAAVAELAGPLAELPAAVALSPGVDFVFEAAVAGDEGEEGGGVGFGGGEAEGGECGGGGGEELGVGGWGGADEGVEGIVDHAGAEGGAGGFVGGLGGREEGVRCGVLALLDGGGEGSVRGSLEVKTLDLGRSFRETPGKVVLQRRSSCRGVLDTGQVPFERALIGLLDVMAVVDSRRQVWSEARGDSRM